MRVTLTDIGRRVGVSPSTVQRALNGREGVGQEKRDQIRRVAEEMGYSRNLTASALKTGARTIGILLPEPIHNNRFYAKFLWDGALGCSDDYREFNLEVARHTYVRTPENHARALRRLLKHEADKMAGLLTMGSCHPDALDAYAHFKAKNVPVVFVGTDARPEDRLCCVRTYDEMAGRMAADLLVTFTSPGRNSKVVMTGDFAIPDQFYNAQGFERHIYENHAPLEILKLANDPDLAVVEKNIRALLARDQRICAVYATSSRNTVPMCRAVAGSGRRLHVIGSDIFPESIQFLQDNVLHAIIHKRPRDQAFQAMQTLINIVIKGGLAPRDTLLIDSVIVLKSNLECFIEDRRDLSPATERQPFFR
ncbi:MAG: LacI family transcriptional regulator [Planctomycetes bacterium]|nr:LacI family transcriptional regulator [Planctomycetota bacterium]